MDEKDIKIWYNRYRGVVDNTPVTDEEIKILKEFNRFIFDNL